MEDEPQVVREAGAGGTVAGMAGQRGELVVPGEVIDRVTGHRPGVIGACLGTAVGTAVGTALIGPVGGVVGGIVGYVFGQGQEDRRED